MRDKLNREPEALDKILNLKCFFYISFINKYIILIFLCLSEHNISFQMMMFLSLLYL